MSSVAETRQPPGGTITGAEKRVIFASSLGTVFEWYDFYLYATLAPFFAALFFPPGNATAALLSSFVTYAAGFLVRPFGALVFGRIGDLVGRKYTFLITIVVMGASTAAVGLLPTYATIGVLAPDPPGASCGSSRASRSAASTAARRRTSPSTPRSGKRGYDTAWIQTTATLGLLLALIVIGICRWKMSADVFKSWGWRHPVPHLARPARLLRLHPAQAAGVADLQGDEGAGQGLEGAPDGQLRQRGPTPRSCCWRSSARRRARGSSGTRASSTRCSS